MIAASRAVIAFLAPVAVVGDTFLGTRQQSVSLEAIEDALAQELPNTAHVRAIREELKPMYSALPKNEEGQLEATTVRYALHRYFVQKYGWYIKGLDLQGTAAMNTSSTEVMKGLAPAFIMGWFEKRLHGKGLKLDDLAIFAATLSDLIYQEGLGSLQEVYLKLDMPTEDAASEVQFEQAMRAYFAELIVGQWSHFTGPNDVGALENDAREMLAEYDDTVMWISDLRKTRDFLESSRRNPFLQEGIAWDRAAEFVRELMQHFGGLTKTECTSLKEQFQAMEAPGTGRVLLSDFYGNAQLPMHESLAYLRNLGVLEEQGMQSPRIVMANYITSVSRCYPFSSYFSICCHDECEDLMGSLEHAIAAPQATPARIAEVVSGLSSEARPAPWDIPQKLLDRLDAIAKHHNGEVPLHGRLFMQWMHHAFPQECSFPHVSGTTSPVTQDEWLERHDALEDVLAPTSDREAHSMRRPEIHAGLDALPWTEVEELVASDKPSRGSSIVGKALRAFMGLTAVVSFALPLVRASTALFQPAEKDKSSHLV